MDLLHKTEMAIHCYYKARKSHKFFIQLRLYSPERNDDVFKMTWGE